MAGTKTITVTVNVWRHLKEIMQKEQARSMNEVITKLLEKPTGSRPSGFGVHKRCMTKLTQKEHEEITRDIN